MKVFFSVFESSLRTIYVVRKRLDDREEKASSNHKSHRKLKRLAVRQKY